MEFDDILVRYVGAIGKYQILFYFFVTSVSIQLALCIFDFAFIADTPDFWCHVPQLNTYNFSQEEIEFFVSPIGEDAQCDACRMYVRDYANVTEQEINEFLASNGSSSSELKVTNCLDWEFDDSMYKSTVVTEVRLLIQQSLLCPLVPLYFI